MHTGDVAVAFFEDQAPAVLDALQELPPRCAAQLRDDPRGEVCLPMPLPEFQPAVAVQRPSTLVTQKFSACCDKPALQAFVGLRTVAMIASSMMDWTRLPALHIVAHLWGYVSRNDIASFAATCRAAAGAVARVRHTPSETLTNAVQSLANMRLKATRRLMIAAPLVSRAACLAACARQELLSRLGVALTLADSFAQHHGTVASAAWTYMVRPQLANVLRVPLPEPQHAGVLTPNQMRWMLLERFHGQRCVDLAWHTSVHAMEACFAGGSGAFVLPVHVTTSDACDGRDPPRTALVADSGHVEAMMLDALHTAPPLLHSMMFRWGAVAGAVGAMLQNPAALHGGFLDDATTALKACLANHTLSFRPSNPCALVLRLSNEPPAASTDGWDVHEGHARPMGYLLRILCAVSLPTKKRAGLMFGDIIGEALLHMQAPSETTILLQQAAHDLQLPVHDAVLEDQANGFPLFIRLAVVFSQCARQLAQALIKAPGPAHLRTNLALGVPVNLLGQLCAATLPVGTGGGFSDPHPQHTVVGVCILNMASLVLSCSLMIVPHSVPFDVLLAPASTPHGHLIAPPQLVPLSAVCPTAVLCAEIWGDVAVHTNGRHLSTDDCLRGSSFLTAAMPSVLVSSLGMEPTAATLVVQDMLRCMQNITHTTCVVSGTPSHTIIKTRTAVTATNLVTSLLQDASLCDADGSFSPCFTDWPPLMHAGMQHLSARWGFMAHASIGTTALVSHQSWLAAHPLAVFDRAGRGSGSICVTIPSPLLPCKGDAFPSMTVTSMFRVVIMPQGDQTTPIGMPLMVRPPDSSAMASSMITDPNLVMPLASLSDGVDSSHGPPQSRQRIRENKAPRSGERRRAKKPRLSLTQCSSADVWGQRSSSFAARLLSPSLQPAFLGSPSLSPSPWLQHGSFFSGEDVPRL
jgi:hypothetical protein